MYVYVLLYLSVYLSIHLYFTISYPFYSFSLHSLHFEKKKIILEFHHSLKFTNQTNSCANSMILIELSVRFQCFMYFLYRVSVCVNVSSEHINALNRDVARRSICDGRAYKISRIRLISHRHHYAISAMRAHHKSLTSRRAIQRLKVHIFVVNNLPEIHTHTRTHTCD